MPTIPTNELERELRKLYLRWLVGVPRHEGNMAGYIKEFETASRALITRLGGQVASLGALADFPVPKLLELSPVAGVVYDEMQQAAIKAGIAAGLNATDTARQILNTGLGQSFKRLNRLARTETVSAYWKNSWDSIADLPLIVMVWGSESSKRTCDYCLSRDGLVLEDGNIRDHPNGRCTPIPTLRSQVKYKGTLQPDGSVDMDPRWADQKVKGAKGMESAGPTTEEQRDPLSGKANPAALSKAQPVHQSKVVGISNADKINNAETMYGTGSKQHKAAQVRFGASPDPLKATGGNISSAQYDAMRPDSQWTKEKQESILSSLRSTPQGKVLAETLDGFQDGGSIARLRTAIDKRLQGETINATTAARADSIIDALRNAPTDWAPDKLYRGMTVSGKLENVLAKYTPGDTLDLNLTSFTSDRTTATRFQSMTAKASGNQTRVMVELIGEDKRTIPIQNMARDKRLFKEKEWVSGGSYQIEEVKKAPGGGLILRISQKGTL